MPTCECCNRTVKEGKQVEHWICEDCKVSEPEAE